MKSTVLVIGGAGYIGSHTAYLLAQNGYRVIILDSLRYNQPFNNHPWALFINGDCSDQILLASIFQQYDIDAVMHFAALIEVGESVKNPKNFYHNNVIKSIQLLDCMLRYGVKKFIFSSSCAVYGVPQFLPLTESHPTAPANAYGKNKLTVEFVLEDYAQAYNLRYVSLRYFNAAGALVSEGLGEYHIPETHVIPLLLRSLREQKKFNIFGDDYQTSDGSCVRDYIHVCDLALAHALSLGFLDAGGNSQIFNLGTGQGYSVKELVAQVETVCNDHVNLVVNARRAGDVPVLLADYTRARVILGWEPVHSDIKNIIKNAYDWELYLEQRQNLNLTPKQFYVNHE